MCVIDINIAQFIKDQFILKICVRLKLFLFASVEPLFTHFGEIVNGVDMRGEVALLSRNIKIRGAPATNSKTLGGHIKVHAHIEWITNKSNRGNSKTKTRFSHLNNIVNS